MTDFKPIERMRERVEVARQESDTGLFFSLMYLGEMLTKVVTAGLVAAVGDDRERHRYSHLYRLVRADGLGDWSAVIDDIVAGQSTPFLVSSARDDQIALSQRFGTEAWQHKAITLLGKCLEACEIPADPIPTRVSGKLWFGDFVRLRNKTRGHGAPPSAVLSRICPDLEHSIGLLVDNIPLLHRPWAYLHHSLSGRYRVTTFTTEGSAFTELLSSPDGIVNYRDGVYVAFGTPSRVDLMMSDVDASDYYFPNGHFNGRRFELLSYITGRKADGETSPFLVPPTGLPSSETEGLGNLDVQGSCFGNIPPVQRGYIQRQKPERDLANALLNDRHPMITLVGRGGIGKTSLALSVLQEIATAQEPRFTALLWFSARDIDLLPEGPKPVKPHVLSEKDVAAEFVRLLEPEESKEKGFNAVQHLSEMLHKSSIGPLLFVFDNFETVSSPIDLYTWLDTHVRSPNKVLITTRFRDFKGDYPIEVVGMTQQESENLIDATSATLEIDRLLTREYRDQLYRESEGHPYVIKVLLGDVAQAGRLVRIARTVAGKDEILDALFERTFDRLSPAAKRVFLTLCNCRSIIPRLAVEAVLMRPQNDKMEIDEAIEEIIRSSFVDVTISEKDDEPFLTVPLVAVQFGKRKLAVSPLKMAVEADTELLLALGAEHRADIQHGIGPRITRLFQQIANTVDQNMTNWAEYLPMLELIARRHSPAWLHLASLYEEAGSTENLEQAKRAVMRFLESPNESDDWQQAWSKLAWLCERTADLPGEINALVELAQLPGTPFGSISRAANRLNQLVRDNYFAIDTDEKQIAVQRLITAMEGRMDEANATDYSRLAWLYLNLQDEERGWKATQKGLQLEPSNSYCVRLERRLQARRQSRP